MAARVNDLSAALAIDPKATKRSLHARLSTEKDGGLKAAAQQFEAIFLDLMMKNMRAAKLADSEFDGVGTREFTDILDQQMSSRLSQTGKLGLADLIVRQLSFRDVANPPPVQKPPYLP